MTPRKWLRVRWAWPLLGGLALLGDPSRSAADAIVRTQAMFAPTIAEYFVEDGRVRVDLEIGLEDLDSFRNLLPDNIYDGLDYEPVPAAERLRRFFENDLTIFVNPGSALPGRILEIAPRPRIRRDEITGESLADSEEEAETVVFARLAYELVDRPETLTLHGPRGPKPASVGFVAYHRGVAVNDFRFLGASQVLELDWQDPWYSRFRNRNLRRQYFAPMSGFLYVEPYEVRKEIIARPRDLQRWVDLGLEGRASISPEMQPELLRRAAAFLREHHAVTIDGKTIQPELARANFLERSLRTSRVIDPPVELDVYSAILGVIFVYPTDELPQQVTMDWDLWTERIPQIPVAAVDQAGALPSLLEPDWHTLEWTNYLKNPELPTLRVLAAPPHPIAGWTWKLRWLLGIAAVLGPVGMLLAFRRGLRSAKTSLATAALIVLFCGAALAWSRSAQLSDTRAAELVSGLLHNVYRAFDFRAEEQIYDVLSKSAQGELLASIYLETRRGLELANQGGARAKVKQIELVELATEPADGGSFVANATWNVAGSVGHWGHVHARRNQYRAELHVAPVDGVWKILDLEILQEERL